MYYIKTFFKILADSKHPSLRTVSIPFASNAGELPSDSCLYPQYLFLDIKTDGKYTFSNLRAMGAGESDETALAISRPKRKASSKERPGSKINRLKARIYQIEN